MRAFVILCCLATAYGASLGYDYERNSGSSIGGHDVGGHGGSAISGGQIGGGHIGGGSNGGFDGGLGGGQSGGQSLGGGSHDSVGAGPAEFTKEFFTYSAPEGEFDDADANNQISDSLKKALRVIFIKGPESSGLENAALQLAKSASDDRTAIYVLNKQADTSELANKLNALKANSNANKPEVHFVKYRTPADAENAQRTIQSQYDNLGGQSVNHNGGVAPVLDFASKAPASHGGAGAHHGGSHGSTDSAGSAYLPPNRRF